MSQTKLKQTIAALLTAALLLGSITPVAYAANASAPAAQLQAEEVSGTLPGGQFAKIWLGLTPKIKGENIVLTTDWDRINPEDNSMGFFVLDEGGLARVLNGSADVRDANLSAGSKLSPDAPANQLGAVFRATGDSYTIVLFNDSSSDANFSLSATNAFITDDSNQVRDPSAPREAATEDGETETEGDAAATDETPDESAATEEATAADTEADVTATPAPAATTTEAVTGTTETTDTVEATPTPAPVVAGPIEAQELRGELPEQNDQHFFGLEPSIANGTVSVVLSFDPQDSSELARRLNFWVLDQDGFRRFLDPNENIILSNIAIAAGSSDPQIAANERKASFTSSGFGPYVVIVYNNSRVAATYTLRVDGGVLTDDSAQSLTAQQSGVATSTTVTSTTSAGDTTAATDDTDTPAAASTSTGRTGEPGGTYTVQAGDTLSLIARDIYGEIGLWNEICAFNGLANCDVVEVGQVIRLPTREEISAGISAPAATATTAAPAATPTATAAPEEDEPAATPTATSSTPLTSTATLTGTGAATSDGDADATDATETTTSTDTTSADTPVAVNVIAALEAQGSFSNLIDALTAAGLVDALEGAGPFTIFAPTDAAFDALPPGAFDQLLSNPTGQLTQILLFHVLPGSVMTDDIENNMQATTQQGKAVNFEVGTDNTVRVNGANVVVADIEASNGVVHAIDAVILPPPE